MRSWLEEKNWLQGAFVAPDDLDLLRQVAPDIPSGDVYLIVASQSCDVCASSAVEEYVEFSIARKLGGYDGNFLYNKHPRRLHIKVFDNSSDDTVDSFFELFANDKIRIKKDDIEALRQIEPYQSYQLDSQTIEQYANWLAGRYNRPALPTQFERTLNEEWAKRKREKASEKVNEHLLGVYADINPDRELRDKEIYSIQLLFIITHEADQNEQSRALVVGLSEQYVDAARKAGIEVVSCEVKTERQISLATFKNYKRFFLDSLSYKSNTLTPPLLT